jgi:hypothetical protein
MPSFSANSCSGLSGMIFSYLWDHARVAGAPTDAHNQRKAKVSALHHNLLVRMP